MAKPSKTGYVMKVCGCLKWKTCSHPWYLNYQRGDPKHRLRSLLHKLVGREPTDFADAKAEAARAIDAHRKGLDARLLLPTDAPTVQALIDAYATRANPSSIVDKYQRKNIPRVVVRGRPFGEYPAAVMTRELIEAYRVQRPTHAGNRDLALLRAMFNWAVLADLLPTTPFKKGSVTAVKLAREEPRSRRLHVGEWEALLVWAPPYLTDFLIALVETGCRCDEVLTLEWHRVRLERTARYPNGYLALRAGDTKSKKPREVPISVALRDVLERRRLDPAGDVLPPTAFAFGDEVGRPRKSPPKTQFENTVLRAHGFTPQRTHKNKLEADARGHLHEIGLRFHDLRREAGSRWLDAGVPMTWIQQWLGHANIATTSTYLATPGGGGGAAMQAFDRASGRLVEIGGLSSASAPNDALGRQTNDEKANKNHEIH